MRIHEQRDELANAIKVALSSLPPGPTLAAFGIAREDCALAHIDYFGSVDSAAMHLSDALQRATGESVPLGLAVPPCDCSSCIGAEASAEAREKHRAAYTNVEAWKPLERPADLLADAPSNAETGDRTSGPLGSSHESEGAK